MFSNGTGKLHSTETMLARRRSHLGLDSASAVRSQHP